MNFDIYVDGRGEHRWRLKARNGKIVADSGEGYATRRNAERAVVRLVTGLRRMPVALQVARG